MKTKKINKRVVRLKKRTKRHFKLTFVPHKKNQYRPHLIRRYGLAALVVVVFGVQAGYNFTTTGSVLGRQADLSAATLFNDTNAQRAAHRLPPLTVDPKLSQAAALKAKDMFEQQYWAHIAPDGTTPWQWFSEVGYNYAYAGENLAKNFQTADGAMAAWMGSKEHRANVLSDHYTNVGFAVVDGVLEGQSTKLIVALYGAPPEVGVAGVQAQMQAPVAHNVSLLTRFGVAMQSLTPAALGSLIMILLATVVAVVAHAYRRRMPKPIQKSWRLHHGAYKAAGLTMLLITVLTLYSGGQI